MPQSQFDVRDNLSRRSLLSAAGAALLFSAQAARAASGFPAKNIQFIIPYAAGGGFDSYVRFISPVIETYLANRVNIVPINVTAGSGSRGITQLYRSKPDGYTIGIFDVPGMFIQQAVQGSNAYDLSRFAWIGCMGEGERYLVGVGVNSPLKSFADLQALSAKRPVKFAVTGLEGTATAAAIIGTEMLGIRRQLITGYRGSSDYIVAAIRGDSDAVISATSTMMRFARAGQLRILASFEAHGSLPGIPDATSLGKPELDKITVERPVGAPPGTPADIQNLLSAALGKALAEPKVVAWAKENDIIMRSKTPAEAAALVARQRAFFERWKKYLVTG
ncbi:MAG TPA: tripartite tricarboxylate transporter substrate binding protein [Micropepsaceae bacterium]|jgi:tripartite-type tricarboxylate transporter receptor subunit TctC|nr:tripartite tricarboxylate transporter substrate binding protein [Micropepsaceae bacterium]